ncbi:MAG: bifunctional deaminase-reductase domain protein [Frankiales bacterium]|nr:bifunctional deaminase-reductase domain protein [Frankiales bacterium]
MRQLLPTPDPSPDLDRLYAQPPGVRLGMVASVDGATVVDGGSAALSGPADRQAFTALRRACDVVLVGAGTARAERYRPVRLSEQVQAARRERGQAPLPRVAVVSRGRGLDPGSPLLAPGGDVLLLLPASAPAPPGVEVATVGDDDVDLALVLAALAARGLTRVLCEGGPALGGALLQAGLVDEVCATTSPLLVGGDGPRLVTSSTAQVRPLELAHLLEQDGVLLARWRLARA